MNKKRQKGIAFFTTLVLLGIIVLICSAISLMALRDGYTVTRLKKSVQAYYLAEAGIEEGLKEVTANFSWAPSGYPKSLGAGTYSVRVLTSSTDPTRKLIESTGTVGIVSKRLYVQVKYNGPLAFTLPAMGGGKLTIAGGSVISDTGPINVHSNNPGNGAVEVGSWPALGGSGRVEGTASAVGTVIKRANGTITGGWTNNAPMIPLPPFDANFFGWYHDHADKVYPGNQTFDATHLPFAGPNHIVYVNGWVHLDGTWTMTGCIVATGDIIINKWAAGVITQHQWQNLPALLSQGKIEIYDPTNLEGMLYADGWIQIKSLWGSTGCQIYGALYGKLWVEIKNATQLHYRMPDPPGLPTGTVGVSIQSWSD